MHKSRYFELWVHMYFLWCVLVALKILLNHLGIQCFTLLRGWLSWQLVKGSWAGLGFTGGCFAVCHQRVGVGCGRCQLSWEWLSWWGRVLRGQLCGQWDWFLAHGSLCIASIFQVSLCSCTSRCFCRHHTWVLGGSSYGSLSWSSQAVDKMKSYQTRTI